MATGLNGPYKTELTPAPMKTKLNTNHYVRGNFSWTKTHHQAVGQSGPAHVGTTALCKLFFFFHFVCFYAQCTEKKQLSTIHTSNDARFHTRKCLLRGTNDYADFPRGSFPPKHPKIRSPIGNYSLNENMNNFSTVHAISFQISSIGAASRKKVNNSN
jgi:hypothetical protein